MNRSQLRKLVEDLSTNFYKFRVLWVILFFIGIFSIYDLAYSDSIRMSEWARIPYLITVSALKSSIILLILIPLLNRRKLKYIAYFIIGIYSILAIINFIGFEFYDVGLTHKLLLVFAQTTLSETSGFLPTLFNNLLNSIFSVSFLITAACVYIIFRFIKRSSIKSFNLIITVLSMLGVISLSCFFALSSFGKLYNSIFYRVVSQSVVIYKNEQKFKNLMKEKRSLPYSESVGTDYLAETVIIVIGESASRSHHSIYGYPLKTTPHLDSMKDSLFVYSDAIGSSNSTSGNMDRILSLKHDDNIEGGALDYPSVIDLFKEAGFKVFWLSNQERTAQYMNSASILSASADVIKYIGADTYEDLLSIRRDDSLLPELKKAISDPYPHKIIFLHLIGSHTNYVLRFPPERAKFNYSDEMKAMNRPWLNKKMAQILADYDNSILFTDSILSQIINLTSTMPLRGLMFYFSDHGEKVYDEDGTTGRGEKYVEVPYLIYANKNYISANPQIISLLRKSVNKPFSTANFEHQLMQLTGTRYKMYDSTRNVSDPAYIERPRFVDEHIWKYEH